MRFFLKFLTKKKQLPSREEMLRVTNEEIEKRWAKGLKERKTHMMGTMQVSISKLDV